MGWKMGLRRAAGVAALMASVPAAWLGAVETGAATTPRSVSVSSTHSCAVLGNGQVKCWGPNYTGQLGNGTRVNSTRPVFVSGLTDAVIVAAGNGFTCALRATDEVRCWGQNNLGQLGDGTNYEHLAPVRVVGLPEGIQSLSVGKGHACATTTRTGDTWCWGGNASGQLGDGTTVNRNRPVRVLGLPSWTTSISLGDAHSCASGQDGRVRCWGLNSAGQLGDGTTVSRTTPVMVKGIYMNTAWGDMSVSAGAFHSCVTEAPYWSWHDTTIAGVTSTSARQRANTDFMSTKCWGANGTAQLGDPQFGAGYSTKPLRVDYLTKPRTASAGGDFSCAQELDNTVKCWGANANGQLGNGTTTASARAVQVVGLSGVTGLDSGHAHSCAIAQGQVKCWGWNGWGQLGNGTTTNSSTPVTVAV